MSGEYYSRQTILPQLGLEGQNKLKSARVLVVGAGGLGSSALTSLAGAGVGTIGICEFDRLDSSNLHRQFLYAYSNVGEPKIDLAVNRLKSFNPFIHFSKHPEKLQVNNVEEIIKDYEYVLDCTDNFQTKFLLNDACFLKKKTLIQASVYQLEGQICVFDPSRSFCARCLWPEVPDDNCIGNCAEVGVLGIVPSTLGNLQALEVVKSILNWPDRLKKEIMLFDFTNYQVRRIEGRFNPDCPLCGANPKIISLQENNYEKKSEALSVDIRKIPTEELRRYTIIDIREPAERLKNSIDTVDAIHLPLSQFKDLNFSFDQNEKYLVFCEKGKRSRHFTEYLRGQGITNAFSVEDGMSALRKVFHD